MILPFDFSKVRKYLSDGEMISNGIFESEFLPIRKFTLNVQIAQTNQQELNEDTFSTAKFSIV